MTEQSESLIREARVAGLREFTTPTLDAVERRRWQLSGLTAFFLVALAAGMALLSTDTSFLEAVGSVIPLPVLRILFISFAAALGFYLFDKEKRLARVTRSLTDERVLSAALSNRLKELSMISEVGKAINQTLDLDDVLRMILRSALDLLSADEGSLMLKDDVDDLLVIVASETSSGKDLVGKTVEIGKGIAGWVADRKEPLLIAGKAPSHMFDELHPTERPITSAISFPLVSGDELLGVLNVNDVTGKKNFSEYDLRAVGLFAEHAAIAIRNSRAFEKEHDTALRLAEVDKMKTDFLATISHELRTPLTSIIGCAKTIRGRYDTLDPDHRDEFLDMIVRQGQRLLEMVEEVLSASKIESGMTRARRERVDLVEVVNVSVGALRSTGVPNPIRVDAPASLIAFADPLAFEQVINNLLDNAVKYSKDPSSPIDVMVDVDEGESRITVKDSGVGIASSDLPDVFERFKQVDPSPTRRAGGVGLGLYIVKNLVEANGGRVVVESEEGKGTTFTVILPGRQEDRIGEDPDRGRRANDLGVAKDEVGDGRT